MMSIGGRPWIAAWLSCVLLIAACGVQDANELLASAKALHAKGERNAAIVQLKSALQQHPEHAELRLYLGLLHREAGDYRGAEKELRRALELKIDPSRVFPALAHSLVMQGEPKKALAEVGLEGITEPKARAAALTARGAAHLALRQIGEARASFDEALRLQADSWEAMLGRARVLAADDNLEGGLEEVKRAVALSAQNADALMLEGDFLRALGRHGDARMAYERILNASASHVPAQIALISIDVTTGALESASSRLEKAQKYLAGNPTASYLRALVAFRRNDLNAARDAIGAVLRVAPHHVPSVLLGGVIEFALGSPELAQTRLRFVVERSPENVYARRLLAASYARSGQTQRAIEILEPALRQESKDPALLALAGELHMQMNEFEKARKYFESAAALEPKSSVMRTGVALSRLAAGEVDLAAAELEAASQLDDTRHQADVLLVATHLQQQQFDQAMRSARLLLQKQPDNPMSHNLMAAAHIGKKDVPAARRSLEKALELQPSYTPAAANLAQLDLQSGDKKAARRRFEEIISRDPKNVQAHMALAALGPRIDASPQEVKAWLEGATKASPDAIQPLVMLARFYFQMNEPAKALGVVEQALVNAPENPEVLELAGQVQLAAGEKNRALATFTKWVSIQSQSPMAFYRLATAQLAVADVGGAVGLLRRAIALRPDFAEAQVLLAETEARQGRIDEALKLAGRLQLQRSKSPIGWVVEGDVRMLGKEYGAAAKAYEKAHALGRTSATAMKLHAALEQDGRAGEGEARLREWLKHQPGDVAVRMYLGEAYLRSANYRKAIEEYEYLSKSAETLVVLNNLAWCYQQVNDRRAAETAEKALQLKPDNPAVMDTLGWILVQTGDVQRGLQLLKKASSLVPKAPEIRFHLAQGLLKAGDKASARAELERLLVDFPTFPQHEGAVALLTELRK